MQISHAWRMKRVAAQIASQEPRIDVLINNAGALFAVRQVTEDGLECTFALNHMAYFVVTEGLRKRLVASAPARIVSTASDAHQARYWILTIYIGIRRVDEQANADGRWDQLVQ
jgi:NAD(P)-dependent dehydrogenase (short-subunit alcohol dehydrogenase family)